MPKRPAKDKEPGFEESLAELERIVDSMEQDELPLESLVEAYEKGSRLLARCEAVLASARRRLEVLTLGTPEAGGDQAAEEFEPDDPEPADEPADSDPEPAGDNDEIRLF